MKYSLEYFSLQYLDMWLEHDRPYHEAINNGTREEKLNAIKQAVNYYKVARNLPKAYDESNGYDRYGPILEIIDTVVASDFAPDTVNAISKVQDKISKAYGNRTVLSVTTKLLWLKLCDPNVIIYDSQTRAALHTADGDLSGFYKAWHTKYEAHREDIVTVCANLSDVAKYAYDQTVANPSYVKDISAKLWFQERVFDTYLWFEGQKPNT